MATLGYSDIKMQMVPLSPFAFSSLISEADIRKETLVALLFTRYIGMNSDFGTKLVTTRFRGRGVILNYRKWTLGIISCLCNWIW